MATVNIRDENKVLADAKAISGFLSQFDIWYRRFEGADALGDEASAEEILTAYDAPIRELMAEGGYRTADVIDIKPDTPNLQTMLDKFNVEHWHDEDEVRFIVRGRGLFFIHPEDHPVFSIEVEQGDMIKVPCGTHHWFDLCKDRRIRAIRLFQDTSGWTPHYTESGADAGYQPLCFGPHYMPAEKRIEPIL